MKVILKTTLKLHSKGKDQIFHQQVNIFLSKIVQIKNLIPKVTLKCVYFRHHP